MPVTDSMFLLAESREHPMHVGGLQLFRPSPDRGPDQVSDLYRRLLAMEEVRPLFRRRPRGPVSSLGQWAWSDDGDLDLEYHVRLSALPRPGRVRELLDLTSRLHGSLLDRHRPLWEFHVIEGLADGRFATYSKIHHALLDGVSALRLLETTLSTDPDETGLCAPWSPPPPPGAPPPYPSPPGAPSPSTPSPDTWASQRSQDELRDARMPGGGASEQPWPGTAGGAAAPWRALRSAAAMLGDVAGVPRAMIKVAGEAWRAQAGTLPFQAPRSILNVPITGARRFAAQSYSLERMLAVGKAAGVTLNDVMLAMCAGALRQYLLDLGALPDRPLVAAVPVSLRGSGGGGTEARGGNAVGIILCTLATDLPDAGDRLAAIRAATSAGKRAYAGLTPLQITVISALAMAPLALAPLPGMARLRPPPFNVLISNVPGPRRPLYWCGARLEGAYPLSIPYDGLALNITATSYDGALQFGLIGCRRSVPSLQRLLTHLETALADLEKATA
jgi:WS/DGAT/MGAT family acyltransferase